MRGFLLIILFASVFTSCDVFDKPELVPAWIEIDEFEVQPDSDEGSAIANIKDCWVFVDDKFVGAYELPARVPIVYNGEHKIEVFPGIYKNGIQGERIIYPFYDYLDTTFILSPDKTSSFTPVIGYGEDLEMWIEDFEDPSFKWTKQVSNSDTTMFVVDDTDYPDLIEGKAGMIRMSANTVYCEMRTDEPLFDDLPRSLFSDAYMELNYKCNHKFVLGLLQNENGLSSYTKTALITFNPTTDANGEAQWNKTYLFIPDVTNFYQNATKFDFYISVINNDGVDGIEIFVDNFKVIF